MFCCSYFFIAAHTIYAASPAYQSPLRIKMKIQNLNRGIEIAGLLHGFSKQSTERSRDAGAGPSRIRLTVS